MTEEEFEKLIEERAEELNRQFDFGDIDLFKVVKNEFAWWSQRLTPQFKPAKRPENHIIPWADQCPSEAYNQALWDYDKGKQLYEKEG
jgi:hypothetical protein